VREGWIRGAAIAVALLLAALGAAVYYLLHTYDPPPVDPAWAVTPSAQIPPGSVTVRWTGTATLVFSDGETTWMTDGWFSRPGPLAALGGKIAPDVAAIERGLARNRVAELAAVFPVHSHYDHAMDAPEVARRTGALLVGSESTANIGRGWGLPSARSASCAIARGSRSAQFTVTPIASRHFSSDRLRERASATGHHRAALPPAPVFAYKVGVAWVLRRTRGARSSSSAARATSGASTGSRPTRVPRHRRARLAERRLSRAYWRESGRAHASARGSSRSTGTADRADRGPFRGPAARRGSLSRGGERRARVPAERGRESGLAFQTLPRLPPVVCY
jgi:ribonuclease BN (tRNA processing enzyme)